MPDSYPIQSSFAAGEITPKMYGAYDTEGYQNGLEFVNNGVCDTRGPVFKRVGTKHITDITGVNDAVMFDFHVSNEESFTVTIVDGAIHIIANETSKQGPIEVVNHNFETGEVGWGLDTTGAAEIEFENLFTIFDRALLTPGNLAGEDATIYQIIDITKPNSDYILEIQGLFRGRTGATFDILIGTTGFGSFDIVNVSIDEDRIFQQINFDPAGNEQLTLTIRTNDFSAAAESALTSEIDRVSMRQDDAPAITVILPATLYKANELHQIQGVMEPNGLDMYITHRNHTPRKITLTPPSTWAINDVVFTSRPAEWAGTNNPASITFFEGRSWWGGPNPRLWGSKSGLYEDITLGALADDAIEYELAWNGGIRWVSGSKNLLIGTELNEFIAKSDGALLKPGDFEAELQSSFGSSEVATNIVNNETLFVSADNRTIRTLWYQWTDDSYVSRDLTFFSDHITTGRVRDLIYTRNPESKIWAVTNDGEMIASSYYKNGSSDPIFGWFRFLPRNGAIVSAVGVESRGTSDVWVAVRRYKNQTSFISIEQYTEDTFHYLDAHEVKTFTVATDVVTGLDRFEGETIQVTVDGATHPDVLVTAGTAVLQVAGYSIVFGYGYNFVARTLPLVDAGQNSSSAPYMKRFNKIFVRLFASAFPLVNGVRASDRSPASRMDIVEPLSTNDIQVANLGWDTEAKIEIIQDLPKSCFVLGVYGQTQQEIPK